MSTFVTSDEHYGHVNILRLCNRPYDTIKEMATALMNNHNQIVSENDTTYHLGDFIWKGYQFDELVEQLNGYHVFIRGNHDSLMPKPKKTIKYEIINNQIHEIKFMDVRFILCHYPIYEWDGSFRNSKHCYGHTHRQLDFHTNAIHIGVDTNDYQPVNFETLII